MNVDRRRSHRSRQPARHDQHIDEEQNEHQEQPVPLMDTLDAANKLPDHPTTRETRRHALLQTQHLNGNARAQRTARAFQEKTDQPNYLHDYLAAGSGGASPFELAYGAFQGERPRAQWSSMHLRIGASSGTGGLQRAVLPQIRRMGRDRGREEELPAPEDLPGNDEMVTEVLTFFYPSNPPGALNDQLRELAAVMLWEAIQGSEAMDWVPRPAGARPGIGWLVTQAVKIAWRRGQRQGIYVAVRNVVALAHRSEYELAREGLGF